MPDIFLIFLHIYVHISFFLNINLWKTCKIALAKCFMLNKDYVCVCMYVMYV